MEAPDLGFRFEWLPEAKSLYKINVTGGGHEQLSANVSSQGEATLAIAMWCRGYRARMREIVYTPGVKHYHLLAEGGQSQARMG